MFVDSDEGDLHFPSLVEGLWTLWICVTTANYPDVMVRMQCRCVVAKSCVWNAGSIESIELSL